VHFIDFIIRIYHDARSSECPRPGCGSCNSEDALNYSEQTSIVWECVPENGVPLSVCQETVCRCNACNEVGGRHFENSRELFGKNTITNSRTSAVYIQ